MYKYMQRKLEARQMPRPLAIDPIENTTVRTWCKSTLTEALALGGIRNSHAI